MHDLFVSRERYNIKYIRVGNGWTIQESTHFGEITRRTCTCNWQRQTNRWNWCWKITLAEVHRERNLSNTPTSSFPNSTQSWGRCRALWLPKDSQVLVNVYGKTLWTVGRRDFGSQKKMLEVEILSSFHVVLVEEFSLWLSGWFQEFIDKYLSLEATWWNFT